MSILLPDVASRKPQPGSRVTCLSLHPTEPLLIIGLSSGELCVYVSRTDGATALLEVQEGLAALSSATTSAKVPPPPDPAKVLRVDAEGFALRHCLFLSGREDDLVRDLVRPLLAASGAAATSSPSSSSPPSSSLAADSLKATARHLVLCITEANSVYLLDIDSGALLLHWDCGNTGTNTAARRSGLAHAPSIHYDSPFAAHRMIVHAACYGALLFLTVADRPPSPTPATSTGTSNVTVVTGADRKVYVCHLVSTNPFLSPSPTQRLQSSPDSGGGRSKVGGPYVLSLRSKYKNVKHQHERRLLKKQKGIRFIGVHPFAPLLLVGMAQCLYVFADFSESGAHLQPHTIVATREALREAMSSGGGSGSTAASASPIKRGGSGGPDATCIVDTCFLPTSVVLRGGGGGGDGHHHTAQNIQLALLTSHRASVLDLSHAPSEGILDEQAFCTPITLTARHSPTQARTAAATGGKPAAAAAPPTSLPVYYVRLYTWIGSPGTLLVVQSDGTTLEYSRNDTMGPLTRVLTVRSRLQHARLAVAAGSGSPPTLATLARQQLSERRLMLEAAAKVPRVSPILPLWGVLDSFATDPRTLCGNPTINANGERRVVFSRPTSRSSLYTTTALSGGGGGGGGGGKEGELIVESIMASTDTIDCSAVGLTAILSASGGDDGGTGGGLPGEHSCGVPMGAMLLDMPTRLLRMEHGHYFVGGRARATDVLLLAGLIYTMEDIDLEDNCRSGPHPGNSPPVDAGVSGGIYNAHGECHRPVLRAAVISLPASHEKLRQYANGSSRPQARIATLPIPTLPSSSDGSGGSAGRSGAPLDLLSVSFQLSNDDTTPCVWALWAAAPRAGTTTTTTAASTTSVLTFQSYFVSADTSELVWHNEHTPEVVHITDVVYQNPSQVFSQSEVGGPRGTWALEAPTVGQLFLYYEENQVLVLGTVVRGSQYVSASGYSMGVDGGTRSDNTLRFCPQATLQISPWAQKDAARRAVGDGANGRGGGRLQQQRRRRRRRRGRAFPSAITLTATLASDGNSLLVAAASRKHGFAVMQFPALGRNDARTSSATATTQAAASPFTMPTDEVMMNAVLGRGGHNAAGSGSSGGIGVSTLTREKLLFTRRWSQMDSVRAVDPADVPDSSSDDDDDDAYGEESSSTSSGSEKRDADVNAAAAAATDRPGRGGQRAVGVVRKMYNYAPVNMLEWMFLASGSSDGDGSGSGSGSHPHQPSSSSPPQTASSRAHEAPRQQQPEAALLATFEAGVVPFLLLQRHRKLYVVHLSGGTVVPLCPAITSSVPIGVVYKLAHVNARGSADSVINHQHPNHHPTTPVAPAASGDDDDSSDDENSSATSRETASESAGRGQQRKRKRRQSQNTVSEMGGDESGGGSGARAVVRVHLVYGDYLGAVTQTFRERQAQQQGEFYERQDVLSVQQARTNTAASPFWLLGGNKAKKANPVRAPTEAGAKSTASAAGVAAGTPGSSKAYERAAARARLLGMQRMQGLVTQEREANRPPRPPPQRQQQQQQPSSGAAAARIASLDNSRNGTVFHMDVTETLSTAVLKMQGMIISQAITDLVSSAVLFSQFIRDTFEAFTRHIQTAVIFGNPQTADIISAVPLASVTYCLSHEMRLLVSQQKARFARWGAGKGGGSAAHTKGLSTTELLVAQKTRRQWWMLVMRSYCVVSRLNPGESEESWLAVQQMLQVAPEPLYPIRRNVAGGSSCEYSSEVIAELLLYCPFSECPAHLWAEGSAADSADREAEPPAAGSSTPCSPGLLAHAVFHALGLLGASAGIIGKKTELLGRKPIAQRTRQDYTDALRDVIKSIPVDGKHWISAVFFCRLVGNLQEIAATTGGGHRHGDGRGSSGASSEQGRGANGPAGNTTTTSSSPSPSTPLTTCAQLADLFADELETEGNQLSAMSCVLEVAESTVAALRGVPFHGSAQRTDTEKRRNGNHTRTEEEEIKGADDMQSTSMSTITNTATANTSGPYAADEQRKQRMNAAIAISVSTRMQVLGNDVGEDGGTSAEEAEAAAAWHQLEENGLKPITTSTLKRSADDEDAKARAALLREQSKAAQMQRDQARQKQASAAAAAAAAGMEGGGEGEGVARREEYFEKGVGLLARLDQLRAEVYARHWRSLYDAAAYPARFLFDCRATSGAVSGEGGTVNGYPLSQLPPQAWPACKSAAPRPPREHQQEENPPALSQEALKDPGKPQRTAASTSASPQAPQQQPVSVTRRVTPLADQIATVREAYAFQSVSNRQQHSDHAEDAGAAAAAAGNSDGFDLPDVRFGEESVVARSRQDDQSQQQQQQPRPSIDDGNYKNRFASEDADDGL